MAAPASPRLLALGGLATATLLLPTQLACRGCASDTQVVPQGADDTGTPGTTPQDEPYTNDWGQYLTMAVLQDGRPALAFYDRTKGALGFAIADTSTDPVTWIREEADGYTVNGADSGDRGKYASMAVAPDGTVWIAEQDVNLELLRWARRDPATATWESNLADAGAEPSGNAGFFNSLAIDATSSPVITHHDEASGTLRVSRWNGGGFTNTVVDEGEATTDAEGATVDADVGEFANLLIQDGVEYLAYYDRALGNLKLAWGTAGNYSFEVVDDGGGSRHVEGGGDVGQWPDMLVHEGQLWIAYHDVGNQDLRLAHGTPGNWTVETVDSGEFVGADAAIFMNGTQPAIAYFDGRNNDMKLATKVGETWQVETVTGAEGALGFHNEVVQAGGVSYLACCDYTTRTVWFDQR